MTAQLLASIKGIARFPIKGIWLVCFQQPFRSPDVAYCQNVANPVWDGDEGAGLETRKL